MTDDRTPEQALQRYVDAMDEKLGTLHWNLSNGASRLYGDWSEYTMLFGARKERVELLNQVAPAFFELVQRSLLQRVAIGIARMTDRPEGGRNVTVTRYAELVRDDLAESVASRLVRTAATCESLRRHRNKRLAHWDNDVQQGVKRLPKITIETFQTAIEAIGETINCVSRGYDLGEHVFEWASRPGGALALANYLRRAEARRDA